MSSIRETVNSVSSGELKQKYDRLIDRELYPEAFANEYSYLRVKDALKIYDKYIKECIIKSLEEILKED